MIPSAVLLLGALLAHAAPDSAAIVVLPPNSPESRVPVVRAALAEGGYREAQLLTPAELADGVDLVRVGGLPDADECSSRVSVEDWRSRFEEARGRFQLLAFGEALSALVTLDVDLVCLSSPPAASDLFRLELGLAEAHAFLAQSAGGDAGKRAFHEDEGAAALGRAASFGASLSVPAGVPPEVLAAYERVLRRAARDDLPRVLVAGPRARVGARFNGRPLPDRPFDAALGTNLVQAADGSEVIAAARLRFARPRTLVWLSSDREAPLRWTVAEAVDELAAARPDREHESAEALLAGVGRLLGEGAPVVYVEDHGTWVVLRELDPSTGRLGTSAPIAVPPPAVDGWRVVIGAGPAGGWSNLSSGQLAGLGGPNAGFSVYGRVGLTDWLSLAVTLEPWAVAEPIPVEQGGGTLFRATIPARLGVRFGPRTRRFAVEGGLDAGLHAFGRFDEGGAEEQRLSFLAVGAGGVSGALGPRLGLRLEAWFGVGLGYVATGASLGLEGRL